MTGRSAESLSQEVKLPHMRSAIPFKRASYYLIFVRLVETSNHSLCHAFNTFQISKIQLKFNMSNPFRLSFPYTSITSRYFSDGFSMLLNAIAPPSLHDSTTSPVRAGSSRRGIGRTWRAPSIYVASATLLKCVRSLRVTMMDLLYYIVSILYIILC